MPNGKLIKPGDTREMNGKKCAPKLPGALFMYGIIKINLSSEQLVDALEIK